MKPRATFNLEVEVGFGGSAAGGSRAQCLGTGRGPEGPQVQDASAGLRMPQSLCISNGFKRQLY